MTFNYYATCHPATAVTASTSAKFTSEEDLNLIVAKSNKLEVYKATSIGLEAVIQTQIYGKVINLKTFRQKNHTRDSIFMLTDNFSVAILEYDSDSGTIVTIGSGLINDRLGRVTEGKFVVCIDSDSSYALIHIYDGILKLVPLDLRRTQGAIKSYSVRVNELSIIDISFLERDRPKYLHIGLIYQDKISRNFRSYYLKMKEMELRDGPYRLPKIEDDALLILPIYHNLNGVILVGRRLVTHITDKSVTTTSPPAFKEDTLIISAEQIGKRNIFTFLLGDTQGNLFILAFSKTVTVSYAGQTCYPSTITYLDNGVLFIGSSMSDSQLIRVNKNKVDDSYITLLDTYLNIGPIVDMEIVDLHHQGIAQLITCSGINRWGSLRVLTNGVVVQERFTFDLKFAKSLWPLKTEYPSHGKDDSLLISFFNHSILVREENETFSILKSKCFIYNQYTIYAGNVVHSQIIQVTSTGLFLINCENSELIYSWKHPMKYNVCLCACDGWHIALCFGGEIYIFEILKGKCELINNTLLEHEVSCISMFYIKNKSIHKKPTEIIALSYWEERTIEIRSVPQLQILAHDTFDHKLIFRSLLIVEFKPGMVYLLAGLGSGDLFVYELYKDNSILSARTKAHLGTRPLLLVPFRVKGSSVYKELIPGGEWLEGYEEITETNVFCCSDQTSIIHHNNYRVVFSYTNKHITKFCTPFDGAEFEKSIIIIRDGDIQACRISDICTYHVVTTPLYETPRRIVYQEETSSFGVLTVRECSPALNMFYDSLPYNQKPASLRVEIYDEKIHTVDDFEKYEQSNIVVINQTTFEPVCSYSFLPTEQCCCVISCKLRGHSSSFYIVGTAISSKDQSEIKNGRLLVFQFCDRNLTLVSDYSTKSAVFNLIEHEGRLIMCMNNNVLLLEMKPDNDFVILAKNPNHVMTLYIKRLNDDILIGDILRSLSVYRASTDRLLEIKAISQQIAWLSAIEILNKNHYLASDVEGRMFITRLPSVEIDGNAYQHEPDSIDDTLPGYMKVISTFNLNEHINVFKHGSLVYRSNEESSLKSNYNIIFGTASGSIGVIFDLQDSWFSLLHHMENQMLSKVSNVGDLDYNNWRGKGRSELNSNHAFIDGDLIENFLNLQPLQIKEILESGNELFGEKTSIDQKIDMATAFIGDLSRLH